MSADASHPPLDGPRPSMLASLDALIGNKRSRLGVLSLVSFASGLSEAMFLVLMSRAAFSITSDSDQISLLAGWTVSLNQLVVLCLILVALRCTLAVWTASMTAVLVTDVVATTRRELATAFLFASWPVQQSDRTGRLQELLTTFTSEGSALLNSVTTAISSSFSLVALLIIAIAVDPLGAIAVIVGATLLGLALRPLRSAVRRRGEESARTGMRFASSLNEVSQLGQEVHIFRIQDQVQRLLYELVDDTAVAKRRLLFARAMVVPIYSTMAYLALVGAIALVAISDTSNIASLGAVMIVMLRSLSYGQAIQNSYAAMSGSLPFVEQLRSELGRYESGRRHDGGRPVGRIGKLELENVEFAYDESGPVLKDFTLSIDDGEVVGIVGPSGCGKSTLVQLLLGLREPDSGSILADGRPISEMSRNEWARRITFVPQAAHLVAGTVADNIRLLRSDVTQEDIERAAALAHLSEDVEQFEERYDREVGEQGGHLSGGQQQRLCIARALVEQPDVLILDEPTSALDVRSEHLIRQTLTELREHMTIIIVAHRLSTLDICDRIMVIQNGELQGFDTPAQLGKDNAFYSEALTLSGLK